jgi:N-formylglutamate amidohydrolase
MPHEALDNITGPRPDVVIGDRFGASASPALVEEVSAALRDAGLRCVRNAPFAGAYVAQHYGKPGRHQHAIQIEVDRALYMNEQTLEKRADFDDLRRLMGAVAARIAAAGAADDRTLAAE